MDEGIFSLVERKKQDFDGLERRRRRGVRGKGRQKGEAFAYLYLWDPKTLASIGVTDYYSCVLEQEFVFNVIHVLSMYYSG